MKKLIALLSVALLASCTPEIKTGDYVYGQYATRDGILLTRTPIFGKVVSGSYGSTPMYVETCDGLLFVVEYSTVQKDNTGRTCKK